MTMLITGVIGIGMFVAFLGFLIVWVPAPPLIVIVVGVTALLIYDFVNELRAQAESSGR
jgi:xanthosine utilization system XapX-like protein